MTPYSPVDILRVSNEHVVSVLRLKMKADSREREESEKSELILPRPLFSALFDPEDGGISFLRNVGEIVQDT
jgi:hypothetical protein